VSLYDWLLFFHVAGAFMVVAGLVFLGVALIVAWRRERTDEAAVALWLAKPNARLFDVGGVALLIFGLWLVFHQDAYGITDGWILLGLGLWLVAAILGSRAARRYAAVADVAAAGTTPAAELRARVQDSTGLLLYVLTVLAVLIAIAVMIFKPGLES
jgi:uncharacterized membrane protein